MPPSSGTGLMDWEAAAWRAGKDCQGVTSTGTTGCGGERISGLSGKIAHKNKTRIVDANGTTVHYMVEGQLDGDSMTGSWSHDDREGDFSITRSE